jgi:hypothetical protein
MSWEHSAKHDGLTLRQAALIAGFTYLLNPVPYAEYLYPKLVISGNAEQTVQNISSHGGAFLAVTFCYLIGFIGDVVIAWSLYVLLARVNRSLSLLAALFQWVYAAVAISGALNLVIVFRLVSTPEYRTVFGAGPFSAQIDLLLHSFRYDWAMSFVLFGIHLTLLGYLIFRSTYIPRVIGILLAIDGLGWGVESVRPYLLPNAKLGFIFITFFGELIFMVWLLIRGWKIKEPSVNPAADPLVAKG